MHVTKNKFKSINEKGLGLLETIAALGLAVVVITSLVSLSVYTLRTSNKGKLLLNASKIANEQVELIRAFRDSISWTEFVEGINGTGGTPDCVNGFCHMEIDGSYGLSVQAGSDYTEDSLGVSTQGTPLETEYSFSVSDPINGDGVSATDDVVRIEVLVEWRVGSETKSTRIYTDVSSWRTQ